MDRLIQAFGIFINDFPYFMLAMALMWDHLRHSRRHAFFVMFGLTALHAASILTISSLLPQAVVDTIRPPHEIVFMAMYLFGFIWAVKIKLTRILFMGFFIKYFADVIIAAAAYFERSFFIDTHSSFGLYFNLCHLALLIVTAPIIYLFITRILRKIFMVESPVWRYLWLAPAAFYALNMLYSGLSKAIIHDGDYVLNGAVLFGISLLVYALILETLRTTQEKLLKEESERRLAADNAALDRLNRTKTEFLQDMSHEMKAPLMVIATGIDAATMRLSEGEAGREKAKGALETIREETQRLGRMVSGMVGLAHLEGVTENRRRVDFAALLTSSAEAMRLTLEQQNNTLRVRIASGLPDVFVENDRFVQVVTNLLSNACDHTRDGQIIVAAEPSDGYITVRVSDTGDGIGPEILPVVFDRSVSGRGGTGYGLYICKTVIEAHGGTINIESAPGGGTTVSFTVPVYGGQEAGHPL